MTKVTDTGGWMPSREGLADFLGRLMDNLDDASVHWGRPVYGELQDLHDKVSPPIPETRIATMAHVFVGKIQEAFNDEELEEIDRRNAAYRASSDDTSCATHEFCDANEYMAEAFQAAMGRKMRVWSQIDLKAWAEAWEIAFKGGFQRKRPKPPHPDGSKCIEGHWNDGTDVCERCGADLN